MQLPKIMTRAIFRLRTLTVAQALFLLVALGVPIVALAAILPPIVIGTQSPNPVIAGGEAVYSVTFKMDTTTGSTRITSVSGLPSGATSSSECVVSASDGTYANTMRIGTAGTTPTGTSTITPTISAYGNTACTGGTTATDSGQSASLVVAPRIGTTTTAITSDTPDPSLAGAAYTVTATVTRAGATNDITGTMTISDGTASCVDTTPTGGSASPVTYSCDLTSTTVGVKTLTATYSGNGFYAGSSGTASHTVVGGAPTKLAITSISPTSPTAGTAFSVVVQSQDAAGTAANVTSATGVSLSLNTGTGTLGGTLTGSILNGASSVTISGVTYSKAETGVILTAARTSGMSPLASGNSAAFTVVAAANRLSFTQQPGGGAAGAAWSQQPVVKVLDASNNVVTTDSTSTVSLAISTNPAGGTLTCTSGISLRVTSGVATFSGCSINLSSASAYTLGATSSASYTAATSSAFSITGTLPKLTISVVSAPGNKPATGYTTKTPKTVAVGAYVTWRFGGGSTLAGLRVNVKVARKVNGVWGNPVYYKSLWADQFGVVRFPYKSNSATAINVRVEWPGNTSWGVSTSKALGAYWK